MTLELALIRSYSRALQRIIDQDSTFAIQARAFQRELLDDKHTSVEDRFGWIELRPNGAFERYLKLLAHNAKALHQHTAQVTA